MRFLRYLHVNLYVFLCFLLVLILSSGFSWLAYHPADLIIAMRGTRITVSLLSACILVLTGLFCLVLLLWLIRSAFLVPFKLCHSVKNRKKNLGYRMLTNGLFAAVVGDAQTAKHMALQSKKLLAGSQEPLVLLLDVQAKVLNREYTGAIQLFRAMQKNPQMQLLPITGQFHEAVEQKNLENAYNCAEEAIKINPRLEWANCALTEKFAKEEKWDKALELCRIYTKIQQKNILTRQKNLYKRVVLMTGQARHLAKKDPQKACHIALKAHALLPSFMPTICMSVKLLFQLQKIRKGTKFVENVWKKKPHPDIGLTYIHAGRQKEIKAAEKLQRAHQLAKINPKCPVSQILVVLTTLETGELALAQSLAEKLARTHPTENTFLLLAGIETVHSGDKKKINNWLTRAMQAPADMAWIVDEVELPEWVAVSPITGHLGTCEWKQQTKHNHSLVNLGYALLSTCYYSL